MIPFNNSHPQFPLSQSPVSVDLGEFMIDSDLDYLGKVFFDLSQNNNGNSNSNNNNANSSGDNRVSAVYQQPSGLYRG